jgi:threonine dehydratase
VRVGDVPFAHHAAYLDDVVQVDDRALPGAVRALLDRRKLVAEPSGAVTLAALVEGVVAPAADGPTVCVLSGGNVEWDGIAALLSAASARPPAAA